MLVAVILFAADGAVGKKKERDDKRFSVMAVVIIIVMLAVNCANTVIIKYYSLDARVADGNSLFFLTNAVLVLGSLPIVIFSLIKASGEIKNIAPLFRPLNFLSLIGNTVCNNVGSLTGILLIAQMDVAVYTPVSSAIGILAGFFGSLIFREKLGLLSYLGVLGALVAVII